MTDPAARGASFSLPLPASAGSSPRGELKFTAARSGARHKLCLHHI